MKQDFTVKERARRLAESLSDDATWDDLIYAIHVRRSVEEGVADADAGRVTSTDDLRASFGLGSISVPADEKSFEVMPWIREVRDRMHDEMKHMTPAEQDEYIRERAESARRQLGIDIHDTGRAES
jgi:hypothetical protein